jgi:hypothetical protein
MAGGCCISKGGILLLMFAGFWREGAGQQPAVAATDNYRLLLVAPVS